MGGASGHISHVWEDLDLTFGDIKDIFRRAAAGKLERVSEKTDGVNVCFTWNGEEIRVARSKGDLKRGGMSAEELASKFAGRGNLARAFNEGFKVLTEAVGALPDETRDVVFGSGGGVLWYSVEIIYEANPNVVNYDGNHVIFHESPVFRRLADARVEETEAPGVSILAQHVIAMQRAVTLQGWQVHGPALVRLKKLSDGSVLRDALAGLGSVMSAQEMSDDDTLLDLVAGAIDERLQELSLSPEVIAQVLPRLLGKPGAPTLTDIRRHVTPETYAVIRDMAQRDLVAEALRPVERVIHRFAIAVLRGVESMFVLDPEGELQRRRAELRRAIDALQSSGDPAAMGLLRREMQRLGNVDDLTSTVEGVVFRYRGSTYKLTGNFAPVNQLLGFFKFGKGKQSVKAEARLRSLVSDFVRASLLREAPESEKERPEESNLRLVFGTFTPWPKASLRIDYDDANDRRRGIGPGERRLAYIMGSDPPQGGRFTYDLQTSVGRFEVKEPNGSLRGDVRIEAEGIRALMESLGRLKAVVARIQAVFGAPGKLQDIARKVFPPPAFDQIQEFVVASTGRTSETNVDLISRGEIGSNRLAELAEIVDLIAATLHGLMKEARTVTLADTETGSRAEKEVDVQTYLRVAQELDLDPSDLQVDDASILLSALGPAFRDPKKFINDNIVNAVQPHSCFPPGLTGLILVRPEGYLVIPYDDIDEVMTLNRISKGKPYLRLKK